MSEKKTRSGSEKRQKNVLIAVRFSPEEAEIVKEKAEKNGLTVSTLIRKTVLGKQINARIDEDFLKELMRLGRLQKHLFVEGKRTGDKEYAEVLVAITELANTLRRDLMAQNQPAETVRAAAAATGRFAVAFPVRVAPGSGCFMKTNAPRLFFVDKESGVSFDVFHVLSVSFPVTACATHDGGM